MQTIIADQDLVALVYQCTGCPAGCELTEYGLAGIVPLYHQHPCHRFPSRSTAFVHVANRK